MIRHVIKQRFPSLVRLIGRTPLVELIHINPSYPRVRIFAKLEWTNPGGSVKDRPAWFMIRHGLRTGQLKPGMTILEATSGNTGIALAMIGSALKFPVELVIPANAGVERLRILQMYGAHIIQSDPLGGTDTAQEIARSLWQKNPDKYFYTDQYSNPWNWRSHFRTTAVEILRQTRGQVTHFIAGLGTTGTFVGTARRLKREKSEITCIAFQPDSPLHGMEGLKHLPTARTPKIYDPTLPDAVLSIRTEDAVRMIRRLAQEEGLLVGVSAAAAAHAAVEVASELKSGIIVTVFPDSGMKYLDVLTRWIEPPEPVEKTDE